MRGYRQRMGPEEKLDALLAGLDARQQRHLLMHSAWWSRCSCGKYGRPYDCAVIVIDADTVHGWQLCQPRAEWIDQRP